MGLLDALNSDDGMLGMGLLAAAAPSMEPTNTAARLANAMGAYRGMKADQLKQQFGQAQMADMQQQMQMRGLQLQQAQQEWALQQPLLASAIARLQPGAAPSGGVGQPAPSQGGAMGAGGVGMPSGGQAAVGPSGGFGGASGPAASGGGSMLPGVPDDVAMWNIGAGGIKSVPALLNEYNKPTDFQKLLIAAGIDPRSAQGQAAVVQQINKLNNIPLQAGRAGAPMYNPDGTIAAMAPKIPDNAIPQIVGGKVVGVSPLPGAAGVEQTNSYAGAAGKAQAKPMTAYIGNQPVFTNELAAAQSGDASTPQSRAARDVESLQREIALAQKAGDPPAAKQQRLEILNGELAKAQAQLTPAPALGAQQAANLSQEELSKKGSSLMADNSNANTVISRLLNIKMLAPGAITGGETSRRDYFNSLLSLAGIKGATDAKTASDLVDKNSAQIVAALRMGQGGGGTDALQTLLGAANPNRHMTKEAMADAADQLIASQKMIQAKAGLLQNHYLGRDPVAYGAKEMQFDQAADPRVWQLQSMTPDQQKAYVSTLPADVASDLLKKRHALKQLGVF